MAEVWSRSAFSDRLTRAIERAAPASRRVAVLHLDLRVFESAHYRLEPELADRVLGVASERLRHNVRSTDLSAHFGNGEFGLIVEIDLAAESSRKLAERLLAACTGPVAIEQVLVTVGGNIGVAVYPDVASEADGLIASAASALTAAKAIGIDTVQMADSSTPGGERDST